MNITDKTIWEKVVGYEDSYEVSRCGSVRSIDRVVPHDRYGSQPVKGVVLIQSYRKDGYFQVGLTDRNKQKHYLTSRLVAMSFVGGRSDEKCCVNHIDGDKKNNNSSNLEWCTHKHNIQHAYKTGLAAGLKGVKHHKCKLTNFQVRLIRIHLAEKKKTGLTMKGIADLFSVSVSTIEGIKVKKSWAHLL